MPPPRHVTFAAGSAGAWRIDRVDAVRGETLPIAERLAVIQSPSSAEASTWKLRGVVSNTRYTNRGELSRLAARQEGLGRPASTRAALIPISKSEAWWALAQDERRAIMEERSHHIAIGLDYLPAIARRLHHCRDLGESFDFLTWFEFAPEHEGDFNKLVARLRQTEEWRYVTREVDIRLTLTAGGPAS
jgi:chlorite dismutase